VTAALRTAIAALDRLYDVLPRTDDQPMRVAVLAAEKTKAKPAAAKQEPARGRTVSCPWGGERRAAGGARPVLADTAQAAGIGRG